MNRRSFLTSALVILAAGACAPKLKNIDYYPCFRSTQVCPSCIAVLDTVIAEDYYDGSIKRTCPKCGYIWFEKPLYKCMGLKQPKTSNRAPRMEWEDAK